MDGTEKMKIACDENEIACGNPVCLQSFGIFLVSVYEKCVYKLGLLIP